MHIKSLIKFISIVLLIPIFIFWLFYYMEGDIGHAWFWSTILGIGNLMLLLFSPDRKITEGIRKINFINLFVATALALLPFFIPFTEKIFLRIVQSSALFVSFIGYSVFASTIRKKLFKTREQ